MEPLGFERLKICELFAELLHCSNMSNLNNFNMTAEEEVELEEGGDDGEVKDETATNIVNGVNGDPDLSVGDYLKAKFVESKAMPMCVVSDDSIFTYIYCFINTHYVGLILCFPLE
jgi:hypothetical protein